MRVMAKGRNGATLVVVAACVAAGCGGGSSSKGDGDAGAGAGLAAKSPQQILDAASTALEGVRSYHLEGVQTDKDGRTTLRGDVDTSGDVSVRLGIQGRVADILVLDGRTTYLRANEAYWQAEGGSSGPKIAKLFADRWVKVPASAFGGLKELLDPLSPKTLAYCAKRHVGTLSKSGSADVGGQPAVVLENKGDEPGTSHGKMYVAVKGRPLPLRVVQLGPARPGGTKDPRCDDKEDTTTASDIRLTRYDVPVRLQAPKGAVDLDALQRSAQQSQSS